MSGVNDLAGMFAAKENDCWIAWRNKGTPECQGMSDAFNFCSEALKKEARKAWHPVSEPPTEADGDDFGEVLVTDRKVVHMEPWDRVSELTRPGTQWARIRDVVLMPPGE